MECHDLNAKDTPVGRHRWAIAEGYIPGESHGPSPEMASHEAACMLNASGLDAQIAITIIFVDREPIGHLLVPERRTRHVRINDLNDPKTIPRDTPYASLIASEVPVVVQHTRLDLRQSPNSLLSTIAFSDA